MPRLLEVGFNAGLSTWLPRGDGRADRLQRTLVLPVEDTVDLLQHAPTDFQQLVPEITLLLRQRCDLSSPEWDNVVVRWT